MSNHKKVLLYGYGNPGRQDDGLGKAMVDLATQWANEAQIEYIDFDANYQLQVEDVTLMEGKEMVIFVDASIDESVTNFKFEKITPDSGITFTMHAVSPGFILSLYQKLYGNPPPSYLLHVRGYEWELSEKLTEKAEQNLLIAWKELKEVLAKPERIIKKLHPSPKTSKTKPK